ncbi:MULTISPECIES: hypothetical protein [Leptotrichia]|nr:MULTISPECIES: hypothetical protein [Leptotrichia]
MKRILKCMLLIVLLFSLFSCYCRRIYNDGRVMTCYNEAEKLG